MKFLSVVAVVALSTASACITLDSNNHAQCGVCIELDIL